MAQMHGREVYTRAELTARYGLGLSTLERWYRQRETNGHPAAVGTVARALAWDAQAWDAWYAARGDVAGLATMEELAERVGRNARTLQALWGARDSNGHPPPRKRVERTLLWDVEEYEAWFTHEYLPSLSTAAPPGGNRAGNAEDLITLAEAARVLGVEPTSITMYPGRPPAGWPEPAEEEVLPSGRTRRRYRRGDIWHYADNRPPRGRRPATQSSPATRRG